MKTDCDSTGANFAHFVTDGASQHLEQCMACDGSSVNRGEQTNGQVSAQPCVNSGPPLQPPAGLLTSGRQCPSPPHLNPTYFRTCDTGKVSATIVAASLLDRHQLFSWQWSRRVVSRGEERVHLEHTLLFWGEETKRIGTCLHSMTTPCPSLCFTSRTACLPECTVGDFGRSSATSPQLWSPHQWLWDQRISF